jgi:hypothetical protein
MLTYPVTFTNDSNQHSTIEYPIGGGNPNLPYAFVDMRNPINPLYFTNNPIDQRYNDSQRYLFLSSDEGQIRLYTPQNAYNYVIEQRNYISQITQTESNKNIQTKHQRHKQLTMEKHGKTTHQRHEQLTMEKHGKTSQQQRIKISMDKTGHTPIQINRMGKKFNIPGKTVAAILTLLKRLDQTLTQQKTLSKFTQSSDNTISINGRQAQLHDVPGRGMNCLLYAMLAANGHDIHAPATLQIVRDTRAFLQTIGRAQENELLEMDTATSQGAEALAYLRSMGHMNPNQGITIHATWRNPQDNQTHIMRQDVIPSQNGASSIELYLDLQEHHYNYIEYLD